MPPPPAPKAKATIVATPKLQGPPPKVNQPVPPAPVPEQANLMTSGEQVRARGRAVLTAQDPEPVGSVQQAIVQVHHNRYTDESEVFSRIPRGNLQHNPEWKLAFSTIFDLHDRHGVGVGIIQDISKGLMTAYDSVQFYENTLI